MVFHLQSIIATAICALPAVQALSADSSPFKADVAYGDHELQRLDVYKPAGKGPFPFVLDIHGGGWWNGDKKLGDKHVSMFTEAGIAIVGTNYRLLHAASRQQISPPVKVCLDDVKRALQFTRYNAKEWDLDPRRVALSGVSAGAFNALWLGLSDDMANPSSDDPVERESTRVLAVGVRDAQTSIDPQQMRDWVGPELKYGGHAFGLQEKDFEAFLKQRSRFERYFPTMSPASLLSSDDPALFLFYTLGPEEEEKDNAYYVHSPDFGVGFKRLADLQGVECHLKYPGQDVPGYHNQYDFVLKKLQKISH